MSRPEDHQSRRDERIADTSLSSLTGLLRNPFIDPALKGWAIFNIPCPASNHHDVDQLLRHHDDLLHRLAGEELLRLFRT